MPQLKIVAACEKVIFDKDGPVSIISMFQQMRYPLPAAPLPEHAIAPNMWSVFTLWENDPKEVGKEFVQVVKVFAPDGALFSESEGTFRNVDAKSLQTHIKVQVSALPIWKEGTVKVCVFLKGDETLLGTYSFQINYVSAETPTLILVGAELASEG